MDVRRKYPRTPHLPWSPGATNDDRVLSSVRHFEKREVVVTVKLDGENTSFYRDQIHARSLDWRPHESRNLITAVWSRVRYNLPIGMRVVLENCFAVHSIAYNSLNDYQFVTSIWQNDVCLSWSDTCEWAALLELSVVPHLDTFLWDEDRVRESAVRTVDQGGEGIVVRTSDAFLYQNFGASVAKYVRKDHVQTDTHWMHSAVVRNRLGSANEKRGDTSE